MKGGEGSVEGRSKIRARRQELGLSQEEVAKESDISQTHLSQIERGKKNPSKITMKKLATSLQSDVMTLFFADDYS